MNDGATNRRNFLAAAGAMTAATVLADDKPAANTSGNDAIKIALIGAGGRGSGAAADALNADPRVKLVCIADAYSDRLNGAYSNLQGKFNERVQVPEDRKFTGYDAYKKALATDVDYVILSTPPHFRPMHFEAAVAAKKNVFMEKPVAVDPVGIRKVLAAHEQAKKLGLSVVAGTQRRHQTPYLEAYERIRSGEVGKIVGGQCYWNQAQLWHKDREEGWSDLEWMIRDWVNWSWLSGDHIVEQHVHNIDVINWFLSEDNTSAHPVRAVGMGGRAHRPTGNQYDFFAVDFEYAGGVHISSYCRQINGCDQNVSETLVGEKGTWRSSGGLNVQRGAKKKGGGDRGKGLRSANMPKGAFTNAYVQEHADLVASITGAGSKLCEGYNVAISTATAIMGRMAAYTGKPITWNEFMDSDLRLGPTEYGPDVKCPPTDRPVPGRA